MIRSGTSVWVYLVCGVTDMRKGIEGLAALAQNQLRHCARSRQAVRCLRSAVGVATD
jgi:transposase